MERLVITNPNIQVVFARAIGDLDAYYKSIRMELDRTGVLKVGEFIC